MRLEGIFLRAGAGLAAVHAFGIGALTLPAAQASTPAPIWRDAARINVLCLVTSDEGVDQGALTDLVCGTVRERAAQGAPVPVRIIALGDPALLSPESVTLLVHASVQGARPERLLAFSIRPFRNSADQGQTIFAAAPRAVTLRAEGGAQHALEAALGAALSETLPWLRAPAGPIPIR